jgi:hypothetical protein
VMSEAPIERPSAASAKSLTNRFCNKRRTPAIEAAGLPLSLPYREVFHRRGEIPAAGVGGSRLPHPLRRVDTRIGVL